LVTWGVYSGFTLKQAYNLYRAADTFQELSENELYGETLIALKPARDGKNGLAVTTGWSRMLRNARSPEGAQNLIGLRNRLTEAIRVPISL
jgi:hypothetical protein